MIADIARRLCGPETENRGGQLRFRENCALSVETSGASKGTWCDHQADAGGGPIELIQHINGGLPGVALDWLRSEFGVEIERRGSGWNIEATYDYCDESGVLLYQKVRLVPKDFRQRRPDPSAKGGWNWSLGDVRRVLYRTPDLVARPTETVFEVEGEKDADNGAARLGLLTTCNAEGGSKAKSKSGKKWRPEYSEQLRGRDIVVIPDNDGVGRGHAQTIANALLRVGCTVRIVTLSGAVKDLSDWIADGGTREQLDALVAAASLAEIAEPEPVQGLLAATEGGSGVTGEILPSQSEVSAAIDALTKDSDPDAIGVVLEQVARARLGPLWNGPMLSRIKDLTGQKLPALTTALRAAVKRLEPPRPAQTTAVARTDHWRDLLHRTADEKNEPKPIMANVFIALTNDKGWDGVIGRNEFTGMIELLATPPWSDPNFKEARPWTDPDTRMMTLWVQNAGIHAPEHIVFQGIAAAAERNLFHPVKEYLDELVWDEEPRIDDLFIYYYGAATDPPAEADGEAAMEEWKLRYRYLRAVGARSLIGAVARIEEPGCKNDCSPTLVGKQDLLKSTSIEALFAPWYTDEISEFGTKDAAMQTVGKWGIEISELVAARRDVDKTKAFMSRKVDHFRPPYGRAPIDQPRQCVFWGTTNRDAFLFDETGNRRSWSVRCSLIKIEELRRDRDQLWAEAVARYRAGERYWLHEKELVAVAAEIQAEFMEQDPWHDTVVSYIADKTEVGVDDLLGVVGVFLQDRDQGDMNRVAKILRRVGWVRKRQSTGDRLWRYFPPDPSQ